MKRIVLMSIALAVSLATANSVSPIQLFPTSTKLEVRRGETVSFTLSTFNTNASSDSCAVYATGLEIQQDGKQLFEKANEKYSAAKWLSIKEPLMEVPPGSVREIEVTVQVPRNAEAGDYFACIFAETSSPDSIKNSRGIVARISVNMRLGSFLYVTVPGQAIPKIAEAFAVQVEMPVSGSKEKEIKISATLQNKCQLRLEAQGEVSIKDSTDQIFDRFIMQGAGKPTKGEALVYPMGARNFSGIVRRPLPTGEYIAEVNFICDSQIVAKASTSFKVSDELNKNQKSFLTLAVEPNLITEEIPLGAFRALSLEISNLDVRPLKIKVFTKTDWIEVGPTDLEISPDNSKSLMVKVSMPAVIEQSTMIGKIILQPERGKPVIVDVVVSPQKVE